MKAGNIFNTHNLTLTVGIVPRPKARSE